MTPNPGFKVTGYLKVEYLADGARVFNCTKHSCRSLGALPKTCKNGDRRWNFFAKSAERCFTPLIEIKHNSVSLRWNSLSEEGFGYNYRRLKSSVSHASRENTLLRCGKIWKSVLSASAELPVENVGWMMSLSGNEKFRHMPKCDGQTNGQTERPRITYQDRVSLCWRVNKKSVSIIKFCVKCSLSRKSYNTKPGRVNYEHHCFEADEFVLTVDTFDDSFYVIFEGKIGYTAPVAGPPDTNPTGVYG